MTPEPSAPGATAPGPAGGEADAVLQVVGLSVTYGSHRVVSNVDLTVGRGELVGLIGANGAGKTTTIDAVSGFVAHEGTVSLGGRALDTLRPHERARAGLGRTWQGAELFDDLTVRENCLVAARGAVRGGSPIDSIRSAMSDLLHRPDPPDVDDRVDAALAVVGLDADVGRRPSELSHGRRKLLGVARALAGSPSVLLLDEPAAGLDLHESVAFGRHLRGLLDGSLSALLVDHDTRLIFDICDRVYVLDFGSIVSSGTPDEVRADPKVVAAYLGVAP